MRIFCVEGNYFADIREQRNKIPAEPLIFVKPQIALLPAGASFLYPGFADELYCGCELVLHISGNGKDPNEKTGGHYYDLITIGINFTALDTRDALNEEELTWEKAKAWNNSSITAGWIPAENFKNKKDINFCLYKNRELVQITKRRAFLVDIFTALIQILYSYSLIYAKQYLY